MSLSLKESGDAQLASFTADSLSIMQHNDMGGGNSALHRAESSRTESLRDNAGFIVN